MRVLGILISLFLATGAAAQPNFAMKGDSELQVNWSPNSYAFFCGEFPDTKRNTHCLSQAVRKRVTDALSRAATKIRSLGFRAPPVLALKRSGRIRLYSGPGAGVAGTNAPCNTNAVSFMTVSQGVIPYATQDHLLTYFMGHELIHAMQPAYPIFFLGAGSNCGVREGWVSEGMADAISLHATRQLYPNMFPATSSEKEAKRFSGSRRYDVPLDKVIYKDGKATNTGEDIYYATNSLFRHIAEVHHAGSYKYLNNYSRIKPDANGLIRWLDNRLRTDPKIKLPLAMVYALFVTDFAGWGELKLPGQHFGPDRWLGRSFGGCHTLALNPQAPSQKKTIKIHSAAAQCFKVVVSGLKNGERTAVKVNAFPKKSGTKKAVRAMADELHLGRAWTTDKSGHHCAKAIREKGIFGMGPCGLVPDTGEIKIAGTYRGVRNWTVTTQYPKGGGFENVYVLSRMPIRPKKGKHKKMEVDVRFTLDLSNLSVNGKKQKNVVGHTGPTPTNSQESLPLSNPQGKRVITYTNPPMIRPNLPVMIPTNVPLDKDGLSTLIFSSVDILANEDGYESISQGESYTVMPLEKDGKGYKLRPLKIGDTGSFPASIIGGPRGVPYSTVTPGTLVVEQFDHYTLRARFSGVVCNITKASPKNKCPNPKKVSGEMVKGFPAAHLPESRFIAYDTPGTKMYRDTKAMFFERRMSMFPGGGGGPGDNGGSGSGKAGGGGKAGTVKGGCDCSCEEFEKMQEAAKSMKKGGKRPSRSAMRTAQKMAMCMQQCMSTYSTCAQKSRKKR